MAKVLWLLTYDTEQLEPAEAKDKYMIGVSPIQWLPWIPQLLTCLVRNEGQLILNRCSQNEASRAHEQISTLEASINRHEEEDKAKCLWELKAKKRLSWKSLQTRDVHREVTGKTKAGKSPQIGDAHLKAPL